MDNPIIFQILLALVALFFIFLTYMNTKTWRWLHVTITIFLFIACIPFGVYAAMTMRTRLAWIGHHHKLEADLATTTSAFELATYGDPADVEGNTPSVVDLRGKLGRVILDRGRVWRGVTATPATATPNGPSYVISMQPPQDPALPAAAPVEKHNIAMKTVLFAFKESATADGIPVPKFYLGEFRVTAASDASITIEPAMPMTNDQMAVAGDPGPIPPATQSSWALYEVMPIDGHEWFAGKTDEEIRAMIPQPLTGLAPPEYEKFIAQFVRDGQQADEVNDPPDTIWYEVKFLKPHKVPVDAAAVASVDEPLPFDAQGRAVLDRLRLAAPGEPPADAEFAVGATGIFDKQAADKLIADGIAQKVRPIYRRKLTDFELALHGAHAQIVDLDSRIRALTLDVASIQASKDKADSQATLLEDFRTKLNDDLAKVKFEVAELSKYGEAVATRLNEVRGELSQLYRSNKALSRELAALNAQMTEEIEQRTRAATARVD